MYDDDESITPKLYLAEYAKTDCEIVAKGLISFMKGTQDLFGVNLEARSTMTLSRTAMRLWQKKYNNPSVAPLLIMPTETVTSA